MSIGTLAGQNADEDPSLGLKSAKYIFQKISQHRVKVGLGLVFAVVYSINLSAYSALQHHFAQTTQFTPAVSGAVVSEVELETIHKTTKVTVRLNAVNCQLGYPLVPKLKKQIHLTRANCSHQKILAQIAYRESTGGIHLDNPASSASGPFQFLDSTWRSSCARFGSKASFRAQTRCTLSLIKNGSYRHHWALALK